jgi:hypothetical protein
MSCVIVLGCYRSGTSAVAGVLHNLGVFMGKDFDPPASTNPKGFFEDLEFKRLFNMMSNKKSPDGLLSVLCRIREAEHALWGVKDPQLCAHLHKMLPYLKEHKIISTLRPKEEIARSLSRAACGTSEMQYMPLVEYYLQKKDEALAAYDGPVLEVDFGKLKSDAAAEVARIAEFVGLEAKQEAVDFIEQQC